MRRGCGYANQEMVWHRTIEASKCFMLSRGHGRVPTVSNAKIEILSYLVIFHNIRDGKHRVDCTNCMHFIISIV